MIKKSLFLLLAVLFVGTIFLNGCDTQSPSPDDIQRTQQEKILKEGTAETGMPAITHFRERKILKDIYEMRDQNITTYAYLYNEMTGKLVFLGESIGFGISAAEQYTNPMKTDDDNYYSGHGTSVIPQADPNGLYSPSSTEGTWLLMKDPNETDVKPVYIEPRVIVSPFKLTTQ